MINTNNPFDSESEEREMKVDLVVDFIENLRQRGRIGELLKLHLVTLEFFVNFSRLNNEENIRLAVQSLSDEELNRCLKESFSQEEPRRDLLIISASPNGLKGPFFSGENVLNLGKTYLDGRTNKFLEIVEKSLGIEIFGKVNNPLRRAMEGNTNTTTLVMRDISIDALKRNKEAFVLLLEYINNLDKILSSRSTLSKVVDFFRAGVKNILSEVKSRAELVELIKKIIKYCDSQIIRIQNNSSPSI